MEFQLLRAKALLSKSLSSISRLEPVPSPVVLSGRTNWVFTMTNRAQLIYKPDFRFGLGGVSLGNEFNKHTDKDAEATLEAAWAVGVRYFDVAPCAGFGLSER